MHSRVAITKLWKSFRVFLLTSCGWALFKLGKLIGGQDKRIRPESGAAEAQLADMKTYVGATMLGHRASYQAGKEESETLDQTFLPHEEYDLQVRLPAAFGPDDQPDEEEIAYLCNALRYDQAVVLPLLKRDPHLVVNYLRLAYWKQCAQAQGNHP